MNAKEVNEVPKLNQHVRAGKIEEDGETVELSKTVEVPEENTHVLLVSAEAAEVIGRSREQIEKGVRQGILQKGQTEDGSIAIFGHARTIGAAAKLIAVNTGNRFHENLGDEAEDDKPVEFWRENEVLLRTSHEAFRVGDFERSAAADIALHLAKGLLKMGDKVEEANELTFEAINMLRTPPEVEEVIGGLSIIVPMGS